MLIDRRRALLGSGLLCTLGARRSLSAQTVVPVDLEPHHHLIFQNAVIRVLRVLIPPGETTGWHEHRLDFANTIVSETPVRTEVRGEPSVEGEIKTGAVRFDAYGNEPVVRRITNLGPGLNHQLAFEILRPSSGHFGKADRTGAAAFDLLLDNARVRAWRLRLGPGASTSPFTQDGPGLRVTLTGDRLIETKPGEIGRETPLRAGDAVFLPSATHTLTNGAGTPLEVIEFELR